MNSPHTRAKDFRLRRQRNPPSCVCDAGESRGPPQRGDHSFQQTQRTMPVDEFETPISAWQAGHFSGTKPASMLTAIMPRHIYQEQQQETQKCGSVSATVHKDVRYP
jgi:hypothetical protein